MFTSIPYVVMVCTPQNGDPIVIHDVNTYGETFDLDNSIGIKSLNVKQGTDNTIIFESKMFVNRKFIESAKIDSLDGSKIDSITNLNSTWSIEFGWSNPEFGKKSISNLVMFEPTITYDQTTRSFEIGMKFYPVQNIALSDIKMKMLGEEFYSYIKNYEKDGKNKESVEGMEHQYSLSRIISKTLLACENLVERLENEGEIVEELIKKKKFWFDEKEQIRVALADIMGSITKDDIPDPNNVHLIIAGTNRTDVDEKRNAFSQERLARTDFFEKVNNLEDYKDLSVFMFLQKVLNENGYTFFANFATIEKSTPKSNSMVLTIIPIMFNNADSYYEIEYIGLNLFSTREIGQGKEKLMKTFVGNDGSVAIDFHSPECPVLDAQANIEQGETTLASIERTDSILNNGKGKEHIDSIYKIIASAAKYMDITLIGNPEINAGDNLMLALAGDLFTGRYKVLEVEHDISNNFTTRINCVSTGDGKTTNITEDDNDTRLNVTNAETYESTTTVEERKSVTRTTGQYNPYKPVVTTIK